MNHITCHNPDTPKASLQSPTKQYSNLGQKGCLLYVSTLRRFNCFLCYCSYDFWVSKKAIKLNEQTSHLSTMKQDWIQLNLLVSYCQIFHTTLQILTKVWASVMDLSCMTRTILAYQKFCYVWTKDTPSSMGQQSLVKGQAIAGL